MTWLINAPMSHPTFVRARWHDANWQHQQIMGLFGDIQADRPRAHANILFRVEPDRPAPDSTRGRVLIQANIRPADDRLIRVTDLDPVLERLERGVRLRLMLTANTVRTINRTGPDGHTRTHRARIPDSQLHGWLKDRLDGAIELDHPVHTSPRALRRGRAQLITTTFVGAGTIIDGDAARRAATHGIGRAKAYGCGMLSLLPQR